MNKFLLLLVIILSAWTTKLSFDIYQIKNQYLVDLNSNLDKQNQRFSALSDQFVNLQSTKTSVTTAPANTLPQQVAETVVHEAQFDIHALLLDQLNLVQANLDNQQITTALDELQQLKQKLSGYVLADSLKTALSNAIDTDTTAISVYMKQRNDINTSLQQQLLTVQQNLQPVPLSQPSEKWQWSKWLQFGRVENTPNLFDRHLQYKKIQLELLLAQQAFASGQTTVYLSQLNEVIQDLALYPDQQSKQLQQNLQNIQGIHLLTSPQLSTLALIKGA